MRSVNKDDLVDNRIMIWSIKKNTVESLNNKDAAGQKLNNYGESKVLFNSPVGSVPWQDRMVPGWN